MNQEVYLVWGNHASTVGIGEIVFTVAASLPDRYVLKPTRAIKPGKLNIIIDEFSNPYFVSQLAEIKKNDPATRYVVVATEFITPVSIFGVEFARTFNFFWAARDLRNLARNWLHGPNRLPSYMQRRYLGFMKALTVFDLLVYVHPSIGSGLADVARKYPNLKSPPVVIYPELPVPLVEQDDRLGFDVTGTITRYRMKILHRLGMQFARAGWSQPAWRHVSFSASKPIELTDSTIDYHYGRQDKTVDIKAEVKESEKPFLFNINPPQQTGWPYSSPMRILRAAMLGQIPVVTKKFGDHEIEDIAWSWDGRLDTALKVIHLAMDREQLVGRYMQSVQRYNSLAKEKNCPFIEALDRLMA
jgi:hypothetical protein